MAGLRDRQKARRREAIMAAAARLFEERGFEQAAMEEIAAAAELSVATVYNYFRSKGDICLAIYRADRDLVQAATDRVIANPPADPVDAVCRHRPGPRADWRSRGRSRPARDPGRPGRWRGRCRPCCGNSCRRWRPRVPPPPRSPPSPPARNPAPRTAGPRRP